MLGRVKFVDVTAVRMLSDLALTLQADGVELALAHGIGQGRDIIRTGEARVQLFPTVEAAIEALRAG
jgi:sulfate permease, SulP family